MSAAEESKNCTICGYLTKEGARIKSWKRRYFVLKNQTLSYYKDFNSKKPIKSLKIKGAQVKRSLGSVTHRYCLSVVTPERILYINADSEILMDTWLNALQDEANK